MTTETVGQLLNDRYRILETIGQGGFGTTYKAIDTTHPDRKLCVIKQFTFQGGNKDTALDLFYKEAEHLRILGAHDQIPTLIDSFDENGQTYLVQQYIDGENLEQELATEGVFSQQKIKELLDSLLPVLDFLHTGYQPIIHRDIKPANIIRRRSDGQFVLVDFGAVKVATETLLAKTGTSIGSPEYVAPEQLKGKPTFASDIYSLGVTCIHLLTNSSPWILQTNDGDWCWQSFLNGNAVDGQLVDVLDKTIEPRLSGRYQSANEVMKEIDTAGENNLKKEVDLASSLRKAKKDVEKARFFAKTSKGHGVLDEVRLEKAEERLREVVQQMSDQGAVLDSADRKDNRDDLASARRNLSDAKAKVYSPMRLCSALDVARLKEAEERLSEVLSSHEYSQAVDANPLTIWFSQNKELATGVSQIGIAVAVCATSPAINILYVGSPLWIPVMKIVAFNTALVSWMLGANELIQMVPGYKLSLPLRLIAVAGVVAWVAQGILNAPDFCKEALIILSGGIQ